MKAALATALDVCGQRIMIKSIDMPHCALHGDCGPGNASTASPDRARYVRPAHARPASTFLRRFCILPRLT